MRLSVRRALAILLILGLAPGTCVHETRPTWNSQITLDAAPVALPSRAQAAPLLGAFRLDGVWSLTGANSAFGSYSALAAWPEGRLLAIGDNGAYLVFSPPGGDWRPPQGGPLFPALAYTKQDVEAVTRDPVSGAYWAALEGDNSIIRFDAALRKQATRQPAPMRDWPENSGPEAMTRLSDGRFIVLAEAFDGLLEFRRHPAVLFAGDPTKPGKAVQFTFAGAPGFAPTDVAELPDGRVLILMRRLIWPLPLRFQGRILIADPATIRAGQVWRATTVAMLEAPLPVDNFEGLAIEPRGDAKRAAADAGVTVWLISDHNNAATQRTLLWKLAVDPARLPGRAARTHEKARD
jgi:hypothetical protein